MINKEMTKLTSTLFALVLFVGLAACQSNALMPEVEPTSTVTLTPQLQEDGTLSFEPTVEEFEQMIAQEFGQREVSEQEQFEFFIQEVNEYLAQQENKGRRGTNAMGKNIGITVFAWCYGSSPVSTSYACYDCTTTTTVRASANNPGSGGVWSYYTVTEDGAVIDHDQISQEFSCKDGVRIAHVSVSYNNGTVNATGPNVNCLRLM